MINYSNHGDRFTRKITTKGWGVSGTLIGGEILRPIMFERDPPLANEVLIETLYFRVCHSDLHQVENDWRNTIYPCIPGHEVIGRIVYEGAEVTRFKVGDIAGVGCMIDSCQQCSACKEGEEQFCQHPHRPTMTYNGYFIANDTGYNTFGGYSDNLVVKEKFVLRTPDGMDISRAAPILCAGVTTYSPMKHWHIKPHHRVALVAIGGLGDMAIKIAKAMGADVTAITTKEEKRDAALALGADQVIVSENEKDMMRYKNISTSSLSPFPNHSKLIVI